jgi:16S rRNA (adenine1518-N6/adenine1519-N6)-dimethyltransferase
MQTVDRGLRPRPRKRFGQHFLEPAWAAKVTAAIGPASNETFLEIGPGSGALTIPLLDRARYVVGIEIDRGLAARLRELGRSNLIVIEGDFLDLPSDALRELLARLPVPPDTIRVAGNLPYNVGSPILFKLIELFAEGFPIRDATVMLQREVANRLLAGPGTKDYGVLTVLVRHRSDVERLLELPAGAFRPAPQVQSTLVRLRFHAPVPPVVDPPAFGALAKALFTRRRKTLLNALRAYRPAATLGPARLLALAGIGSQRRPETLAVEELARLSDLISAPPAGELLAPD